MSETVRLMAGGGEPAPQKRVRSVEELSRLRPKEIGKWLQYGIGVWTSDLPSSERLAAFAPLALDPHEPGPFQLFRRVREMTKAYPHAQFVCELKICLVYAVSAWSFTHGPKPGAFLLEFAGWLSCEDIEPALRSMMARPVHGGQGGRDAVARALAFAICRCARHDRMAGLGRRMSEWGLTSVSALMQIASHAAATYPEQLPDLLNLLPDGWDLTRFTLPQNRLFAHKLVDKIGFHTICEVVFVTEPERLRRLSLLLQTHRLAARRLPHEGGIEIQDKQEPDRIVLKNGIMVETFLSYTTSIFEEQSVGELGISDEDLAALAEEE